MIRSTPGGETLTYPHNPPIAQREERKKQRKEREQGYYYGRYPAWSTIR